jgi:5'-phosphate synthase pdxT subunit
MYISRRSNAFGRVKRKLTWGTCAGLILLSESANRTKKGGQELIGGLDVRVNRNHFGRQVESFTTQITLPFIEDPEQPYPGVFIRAPVVEKILPHVAGEQRGEAAKEDTVVAPSRPVEAGVPSERLAKEVEILGTFVPTDSTKQIVAVRQGNCFGTSFHPELTSDARIHTWWLQQVLDAVNG